MKKIVLAFLLLSSVGAVVAPPSSPVNVSYVYSDSMEPTIHTDDGYILVPANDIQSGDIITFRAPEKGVYATHRVVGKSPRGFITKGDNNPAPDQEAGYSYVQRDEVVGEVLTYDGHPVLIPHLGDVITALQSAGGLAFLGLAAALFLLAGRSRTSSQYVRDIPKISGLILPVLVLAAVLMVVFPVLGGSAVSQTFIVTSGSDTGSGLLHPGETETHTIVLNRSQSPLTTTTVSVQGATLRQQTRNASTITVVAQVKAPDELGPKEVTVLVYSYPALLPHDTLATLQRLHPLAASGGVTLVVLLPLTAIAVTLIDLNAPFRNRKRSRPSRRNGP